MRFMMRLMLVLMALVFVGCWSDPGPTAVIEKVVPVSGTLTYQGQPLEYFQVTFMPTDGRRPATGVTDKAGKFTLGTNDAGDGAPPGASKIAVVWVGPPSTGDAGTEAIIDDPALLPKPSVAIPTKYNSEESSGLTQDVPASGLQDFKLDLK